MLVRIRGTDRASELAQSQQNSLRMKGLALEQQKRVE